MTKRRVFDFNYRNRFSGSLKENPAKLVDMDTHQGVMAQKNEYITNS
ncbi:MAG: hypothetical protein IJV56_04020 [Neisseriaceae bacterium]|nr:hypothetical protein [Neisseriaceae bacterium]MBR1818727.1 hypothetical protein [Neisseriaceae bacterium]